MPEDTPSEDSSSKAQKQRSMRAGLPAERLPLPSDRHLRHRRISEAAPAAGNAWKDGDVHCCGTAESVVN